MPSLTEKPTIDQDLSPSFLNKVAHVKQVLSECTLVERIEIAGASVLASGEEALRLKEETKKSKHFKELLDSWNLDRADINKYIKVCNQFIDMPQVAALGASILFSLSAPRYSEVRHHLAEEEPNQLIALALKKQYTPTPRKRTSNNTTSPPSNGCSWERNSTGGRKLCLYGEIQASPLLSEPGPAEWFEAKYKESTAVSPGLEGNLFAVISELRKNEMLVESQRQEIEMLRSQVSSLSLVDKDDADVKRQAHHSLLTEEIDNSEYLEEVEEYDTDDEITDTDLIPQTIKQSTTTEPMEFPQASERYKKGWEVGQVVRLNTEGKKSLSLAEFCRNSDCVVIREIFGKPKPEEIQTMQLMRPDGEICELYCFGNWIEDDIRHEARVEKAIKDPKFNFYKHLTKLARDVKTFLALENNKQAENKIVEMRSFATTEIIWFDEAEMIKGQLVFVPGGKDFLADFKPTTFVETSLFV